MVTIKVQALFKTLIHETTANERCKFPFEVANCCLDSVR